MDKRRVISVPNGAAKKIAKDQRCGITTVYQALNGSSHSQLAKHIRHLATTIYGGVEVTKVYF
ncbi:MAG: hypothetical protein K6A96_10900 [Prevotella sp.]|nr:hypothetical protein [Prevotella sp.]